MLRYQIPCLLVLLCLVGCAGSKRPSSNQDAVASSSPSIRPGEIVLEPAEKMLFSEVDEFVGLGREAMKDSLWFQAAEDFDSALVRLSVLGAEDSLSTGMSARIMEYRESVQKYLVEAVGMTTQATRPAPWTEQFDSEMEEVSDSTVHVMDSITHHLDARKYDLPLTSPLNERILQAVAVFMGPGRGYFTKWLNRKSKYDSLVIQRLQARGMPKDLIYLAMVESGFNPKAWSKAAAAGMWQFISGTGRRYGLKDDWWYDPRRDPVLATEAALDYLSDLHAEFGDWHQAMAAYNCGEGRVRRLRNANPSLSYWDMPLPKETRFYVPKILAAMIIGHNPERYGFKVDAPEPALAYDTATVIHCLSIATIARAAEVSEDDIINLNPALRRWCTPPNRSSHRLYLPPGKGELFARNYEKLDKTNLVNWHHHVVARGENLGSVASRYRVSVAAIQATNKMKGNRLRVGQSLLIPLAPEDAGKYAERDPEESYGRGSKFKGGTYKVRPGDNLFDIARKAGTTVSRLLAANNLKHGSVIRPGQRLKLSGGKSAPGDRDAFDTRSEPPLPASARSRGTEPRETARDKEAEDKSAGERDAGETRVHVVTAGDNLFSIARKLGVSMADLTRWNDLQGNNIQPGQRLKYHARAPEPASAEGSPTAAEAAAAADKEPSEMTAANPKPKGVKAVSTPVPGGAQGAAGPNGSGGARGYHQVKPGENIFQIARQHGLDQRALMDLNGLGEGDKIFPGDSILVSGAATGKTPVRKEEKQFYVVKAGDSLWDISVQFRTTVQKLKELNGSLTASLKPGIRIRVR